MTLIVEYRHENDRVLAGDVLLSSTVRVVTPSKLPTRFDGNLHPVNRRVVGVQQKIFCINSQFAVGWSANHKLIASAIIRDIERNIKPPYTPDSVAEIKRRVDILAPRDTSFVFWLQLENQDIDQHYHQMLHLPNPQNEDEFFLFGGSGGKHFFTMGYERRSVSGMNKYSQSIAALLARVARTLYTELTTPDTHDALYGGGYELIMVTSGGFEKVPLTFAFWRCDQDELRLGGTLFSSVYDANGILGFRQFLINRDTKLWHQEIFAIDDFLNSRATAAFDYDQSIKTPWNVHYFISREDCSPMSVKILSGDDPDISVEWNGTEIVSNVGKGFAPELEDIRRTLGLTP